MNKQLTLLLLVSFMIHGALLSQSQRDLRFNTQQAMYAANEEWLTFACEVPEGTVDLGLKYQSDMYWYSLYNLGNLTLRSGMGIHAVSNPLFVKHATEDKGMPWSEGMPLERQQKFMMHKIAQFKAKTGAAHLDNMFAGYGPPKGAFPIYLEYESGEPTFVKDPMLEDFGTLRWDKETFDKTMSPGAWGQTMMKQILWSRDFFNGNRESKGITYLGVGAHDGAHGFRGSMLLAMALAKSYALKSTLAYNAKTGEMGGVDPMTYDPEKGAIYYPHKYKPVFEKPMPGMMAPPIPAKFDVIDKNSDLFDVSSLLWALTEFYYITDPMIEDNFDALFGDPMWVALDMPEEEINKALKNPAKTIFPAKDPHMLSKGITAVNFKNMSALHFNMKSGTFVDTWNPETGQGNHISLTNAGMAIIALGNANHRLHDVEMMRDGAKKMLLAQANFLLNQQNSNGSIANGFTIGSKVKADGGKADLISQAFAIRGWLVAYRVSNDKKYLQAAEKNYDFISDKLWSESAQVYRTRVGAKTSEYNGLVYGAVLGALRELAIARSGGDRKEVTAALDNFFNTVKNVNGLQIAEINMTGEMIPSPEKAKEMMGMMAQLEKSDPEKAMAMKKKMMDSDQDGVPKPKFVMGTKKGAAPVTAGSVTISTK
jgi:hypothetical protein